METINISGEAGHLMSLLAEIDNLTPESLNSSSGLIERLPEFVRFNTELHITGGTPHIIVSLKPTNGLTDAVTALRTLEANRFVGK